MRIYGGPWNRSLPTHPLLEITTRFNHSKGFVSNLYKKKQKNKKQQQLNRTSDIISVWSTDLKSYDQKTDWRRVWNNIPTSFNCNHQLLNFKVIHMLYLTWNKHYQLKLIPSPTCLLYSKNQIGTYIQMFWECLVVYNL